MERGCGRVAFLTEAVVMYHKTTDRATFLTPHLRVEVSQVDHTLGPRGVAALNALAVNMAEAEGRIAKAEHEGEAASAARGVGGKKEISFVALEAQYRIHNWPLFVNCAIVLSLAVLMFFVHSALKINLDLAWTAIAGAMTLLLLGNVHDFDGVMHHIEWSTLLFFAALFILMEALNELGLIMFIGDHVSSTIIAAPASSQMSIAIALLVWVSALVSAFVDNIPYTAAMVPIVLTISERTGLPLRPLLWSLVYGTCLGGNGTLIGASANVVTAGMAGAAGYPISFGRFFKQGFPFMLATVASCCIYLYIAHVGATWHPPEPAGV